MGVLKAVVRDASEEDVVEEKEPEAEKEPEVLVEMEADFVGDQKDLGIQFASSGRTRTDIFYDIRS